MSNRSYVVGFVCGVLAIAAAAGCATQRNQIKPAAMQQAGASSLASIAGVWEGEVWEQAPYYPQGVRRITLDVATDGTWTAKSGDVECASGTATIRGGLVFLRSTWRGPDFCMPYARVERRAHAGRLRHDVQGARGIGDDRPETGQPASGDDRADLGAAVAPTRAPRPIYRLHIFSIASRRLP